MPTLRISRVTHATTAEGPGLRSAVWFQGCSIRCAGCINPQLFSAQGGEDGDIQAIVDDAVRAGSEGLTLLGGEPFDQPGAGADLAELAQSRGLGVMSFSGFAHENLRVRDADTIRMLAATDLLIDGPYDAASPETTRSLVGSTNQRFIHLTDRYAGFIPEAQPNRVDVRIGPDGVINIAGFLTTKKLLDLTETVGARRVRRPIVKSE